MVEKLTPEQIAEIRASNESREALAQRFNVSLRVIKRYRAQVITCLTNREIRERERLRQRVKDVRRENERQLRSKLRAEISAINWS